MNSAPRPVALITGASSGIGFELAKCCAAAGYDLAIAADEPEINTAAEALRRYGVTVNAKQVDLATLDGVRVIFEAAKVLPGPLSFVGANAGHGLGNSFLRQDFGAARHVLDTNVTGTLYLLHLASKDMLSRHKGYILIISSIASAIPGAYQAVYSASKAFISSFAFALREELAGTGVSVTCLMPGPTDTNFFARARMLDTPLAQGEKEDPAEVAQAGFEATMRGEASRVPGWHNKLQTAFASILPATVMARQQKRLTLPGSGRHSGKSDSRKRPST